MNKIICQKCGGEISNEYRVTLSFCTNCGAALNDLTGREARDNTAAKKAKPGNRVLAGIFLSVIAAVFLIGGGFIADRFLSRNNGSISVPRIAIPGFGSVPASEVTAVSFDSWQHHGLLHSGDGYVQSTVIDFRRDGSVSLIEKKDSDDGKTPDLIKEKRGRISPQQFELLARTLIENDFFSQTDSTERISESDRTLKVEYTGGEKQIKTSNIDKDTPEIKAILKAIDDLQRQVNWNAAN